MLSKVARFLLVGTSLAPVLGAFAVNAIVSGKNRLEIGVLIAMPLLLVIICVLILRYIRENGERLDLAFSSIKTKDENVLAFLVAYLLPLFTKGEVDKPGSILTGLYVLVVLFLAMSHSNAYHFNPILGLIGYHFYEAQSGEGISVLLITPKELLRSSETCKVVQISSYVFMQVGGP